MQLHNPMKRENKGELLKCMKCEYQTIDSTSLGFHATSNHELKENSKTQADQSEDFQTDGEFICGQCGKSFGNFDASNEHIDSHNYKCFKCDFECSEANQVMLHERTEHVPLKCKQKQYGEDKSMKKILPTGYSGVNCIECCVHFANTTELNNHAKIQMKEFQPLIPKI